MAGLKQLHHGDRFFNKNPHLVHKGQVIYASSSFTDAELQDDVLIPGLPDSIALCCLARAPLSSYPQLQQVSRSWKRALRESTSEIVRVRQELGCSETWVCLSFSCRPGCSAAAAADADATAAATLAAVRAAVADGAATLSAASADGAATFAAASAVRAAADALAAAATDDHTCRRATNFFTSFNPGQNTWRSIGYMPGLGHRQTLRGYACVGLGGKMYVIGGKLSQGTERARRDVYAYDCIAGTWERRASMAMARVDFACCVCRGRIFVSGGRHIRAHSDVGTATAECYVPESDTWIDLPAMRVARFKCVGVTLGDKVYVIGGYTPSHRPWGDRSSVEVYDDVAGAWEFVRGMWPVDIPPYQVVQLQGRLYRSGDQLNPWRGSIDEYDESLNLWKTVRGSRRRLGGCEAAGAARRYVTIAGIGVHLLFFGGHCEVTEEGTMCFETVDAFEPATGKWSTLEPSLKQCRELCSPCGVITA